MRPVIALWGFCAMGVGAALVAWPGENTDAREIQISGFFAIGMGLFVLALVAVSKWRDR